MRYNPADDGGARDPRLVELSRRRGGRISRAGRADFRRGLHQSPQDYRITRRFRTRRRSTRAADRRAHHRYARPRAESIANNPGHGISRGGDRALGLHLDSARAPVLAQNQAAAVVAGHARYVLPADDTFLLHRRDFAAAWPSERDELAAPRLR